MDEKEFNLEHQYQLFLQRMALKEHELHPIQKKMLRQTFMAACGQMLILFRDGVGAIQDEDKAVQVMENMINQVGNYWIKELGQQN